MAISKAKEWSDFPLEQYQQEAARLVHFSGKTVNSNVPACGVRIERDCGLDLPPVNRLTVVSPCRTTSCGSSLTSVWM